MTDIASLGLKVESSQVEQATAKLDDFVEASGRAEAAAEGVGEKISESNKEFDGFTESIDTASGGADELGGFLKDISSSAALTVIGITAAALAAGVMAKAYIEGSRESETLAKSIALTGNAAGVAVSQLQNMAAELDDIRGTQADATAALGEFVSTGKIAAQDLVRFTALGQDIERNLGVPIKETAKAFADLAEKPSKAAATLQKSFNFLTPAIYNYIVAQEKAGDIAGAAATAQNAYAAAQEKALAGFEQNVPLIIRGWRSIKDVASEAWDAMLGVGRDATPEEKISELQERLANNASRVSLESIQAEIDAQKKIIAERDKAATAAANLKKETDAYIESQAELASKADEFADAERRIAQAWTQFDISAIDRGLNSVLAQFDNAQDELEAQRAANLLKDAAYYAARRELIQKSLAAEVSALRAANVALGKQDGLSSVDRIAAQNKIAENEARILDLKRQSTSQLKVLSTQEAAALKETADAYADAQESADRYVQTLIKRFEIESKGLGLGEEERKRLRERAAIEDDFEERRQRIDRDFRRGDIKEDEHKRLLQIEEDALKRSLDNYDKYYEELQGKQSDWRVGASEAINNFMDDAANVAEQFEELFTNAFDGALDSLVDFAMTGKSSFGDLVKSVIADLLRIQLKIQGSKLLGSLFGGLSASGPILGGLGGFTGDLGIGDIFKNFGRARKFGGPVEKGKTYLVNEDTPRSELFTAPADGLITPHGEGGGNTVNIVNHNNFGNGNRTDNEMMLERHTRNVVQQVNNAQRRQK